MFNFNKATDAEIFKFLDEKKWMVKDMTKLIRNNFPISWDNSIRVVKEYNERTEQ